MSTKEFTQNIANDGALRRRIFRILIGSILTLSLCYIYLIGTITFNVLARKSLENNVNEINSRVGQLELESIALANSIDITYGKEMGYVEAKGTLFANKDSNTVALR
ncbi:MAG: hypothetical protein QG566_17 [Patescibacteria group bacterium]|jgi:hypothetical protein|nr:hypothetical protein [Patescibacteria group bacterium]